MDFETVRSKIELELEDKSFDEVNQLIRDRGLSCFGYKAIILLPYFLTYERIHKAYMVLVWH